jgi:hypothetical protein
MRPTGRALLDYCQRRAGFHLAVNTSGEPRSGVGGSAPGPGLNFLLLR